MSSHLGVHKSQTHSMKMFPTLYKGVEMFDTSKCEYWTGVETTFMIESISTKALPFVPKEKFSKTCDALAHTCFYREDDVCISEFKFIIQPQLKTKDGENGLEEIKGMSITTPCIPECLRIIQKGWETSNCIHLCFLVDDIVTLVNIQLDLSVGREVDECGEKHRNKLFDILQKANVLPKSERHYRNLIGAR